MKGRIKWIIMVVAVALALLALWQVRHVADEVRQAEATKIRLWANTVGRQAELIDASRQFFEQATIDEHRKMQLYTDILQSFNDPDFTTDLRFSLAYINYIVDSSHTDIVIASAADSIISVPTHLSGQKLTGDLLDEYAINPPFRYKIWGMPMMLFYKVSQNYTQLRHVIHELDRSVLNDVSNNTVSVPVIIVDSSRTHIIAAGNIDTTQLSTPQKLQAQLEAMARANTPILLRLGLSHSAYVYYEDTPLLRSLRWLPLFYFFIAFVLILVSYNLFRTARSNEQNRIWVGLAKETAHQIGTPLSSLMAWTEYLRGQEFSDEYASEVQKDLHRLETITHRFSKIGSLPELTETNIRDVVVEVVDYLRSRSPRKVTFSLSFSNDEPLLAPLNATLFQWVIENLCRNAIDAMQGEGTITITASQDARKIYIDVADTGRGMTPSIQKKIFQSGFTTKTRGWGLGLPLARRIINQYHRGNLFLKYSVPGQGTVFRIALKKK